MSKISGYIDSVFSELKEVFDNIDESEVDNFVDHVADAEKIFVVGAGRVGTSSRALAMRLVHLGKPTYWLQDDTTPSNGRGDLLIANSGSGNTQSTYNYVTKAKEHNTKVATITANADGKIARVADSVILMPGQTYNVDRSKWSSTLPLGSQFELCLWVLHDFLCLKLAEKLKFTEEMMALNHRILE